MYELEEKPRRALCIAAQLPDVTDEELSESLAELKRLGKTLGVVVAGELTQRLRHFDSSAYLGTGKRVELKTLIEVEQADTLLVDHEISPSQARNLEKELGVQVLDRTAVILEIFQRHARSRAAKAQVEIVRLEYLTPRLRESPNKGKERQAGKGSGESHLETDRRKIRDRIAELTVEIQELDDERKTQRARRKDSLRVALVGYTNAGKSTLMRALTGSDVYVADKLFATLDTTVRALPGSQPPVLVSDTVGFIKSLPHGLVASFKSTLDEALEASLLLQVVDASDPSHERQLAVTSEVLEEIGAGAIPRLYIFNKMDRFADGEAAAQERLLAKWNAPAKPVEGATEAAPTEGSEPAPAGHEAVCVSAKRPEDVLRLRETMLAFFRREMVEEELLVGYDRQSLRGAIYGACEVLGERYDETGVFFRVRAHPNVVEKLRLLVGSATAAAAQREQREGD